LQATIGAREMTKHHPDGVITGLAPAGEADLRIVVVGVFPLDARANALALGRWIQVVLACGFRDDGAVGHPVPALPALVRAGGEWAGRASLA
jgi:hypothetical protein